MVDDEKERQDSQARRQPYQAQPAFSFPIGHGWAVQQSTGNEQRCDDAVFYIQLECRFMQVRGSPSRASQRRRRAASVRPRPGACERSAASGRVGRRH